ncbi:hypothetical protein P153DRAFT_391198 [Dothidotthia symphoricarpi CBS 119687]|uniref:Uncharacterized protein n=1 Tax=Dothidotthia symphoricarpi CBS 119687 TaxID=1392245 RepID=A0A6A5ZZD5_9PLEO|nr:uncharacterized protein P153DRAFT_391198 [Dothidotthia symphoricarpi CBS 119687]KAF2123778.1 hypothetical protein P153DRAFT_391198 [Dothidotthia symphoricarpi CBS 119687]
MATPRTNSPQSRNLESQVESALQKSLAESGLLIAEQTPRKRVRLDAKTTQHGEHISSPSPVLAPAFPSCTFALMLAVVAAGFIDSVYTHASQPTLYALYAFLLLLALAIFVHRGQTREARRHSPRHWTHAENWILWVVILACFITLV